MSEELTIKPPINWNSNLEQYFAMTGEKAHCYSWLHKRAEEKYSSLTTWIDIPVIILSSVNAAISVGSISLFGNADKSSVGVGAVALITAIMGVINSYFSWARRAEGHRISSLNYAKLYRFLSIEMSLPRNERMNPSDLLKYVRNEYDRLSEVSPLIPPKVIELFKQRFSNEKYENIAKPEESNGLHEIVIYKAESNRKVAVASPMLSPAVGPIENIPPMINE